MPVAGKKLYFVNLEDGGAGVMSFTGDFCFQEGLKCVQFPRTSLDIERARSGPTRGRSPGGPWPCMLPPPSAQHPLLGAALICDPAPALLPC